MSTAVLGRAHRRPMAVWTQVESSLYGLTPGFVIVLRRSKPATQRHSIFALGCIDGGGCITDGFSNRSAEIALRAAPAARTAQALPGGGGQHGLPPIRLPVGTTAPLVDGCIVLVDEAEMLESTRTLTQCARALRLHRGGGWQLHSSETG